MEVLGYQYNQTQKYHPSMFVTISEINSSKYEGVSDVVIRGREISSSESNTTNFASKFEDTNLDNQLSSTSALLQAGEYADKWNALEKFKGRTLITKTSTTQVWAGVAPQTISLSLEFKAFTDPQLEVERPIKELMKIFSPKLIENQIENTEEVIKQLWAAKGDSELEKTALGYAPNPVNVSIMQKYYNNIYFIESLNISRDRVMIDRNGDRIYQVVELSLGSRQAVTKESLL
jgi:hypothetical protein